MHKKLIFALSACCACALPFVYAQPAEVAIRADAATQSKQSVSNIEGLQIASIDIEGIAAAEQHKNAEIFLTLMKSKGETVKQPDYIHYLIEYK